MSILTPLLLTVVEAQLTSSVRSEESAMKNAQVSQKIREVDVKSLEFHFCRGDFEKWVAEVLEDKELADEIKSLQNLNQLEVTYGINFT